MSKLSEKVSPIETHKKADLILIREKLLNTIENDKATAKDITDASKLLARMHKALTPEKITERTPQEKKKAKELTPSEKAEMDSILDNK